MLPTSHTVVCMPTTALTGSGPASGYNHIIVSLPFNIPLAHTRARPNIHTHMRAQIHAKYMHTGTNTHAYPRTHTHTHTQAFTCIFLQLLSGRTTREGSTHMT